MWRSIDRDNIKVSSQPVDNTGVAAEQEGEGLCSLLKVSVAPLDFNQQHDLGPGEAGGWTLKPKQSITSTDQQSLEEKC